MSLDGAIQRRIEEWVEYARSPSASRSLALSKSERHLVAAPAAR